MDNSMHTLILPESRYSWPIDPISQFSNLIIHLHLIATKIILLGLGYIA